MPFAPPEEFNIADHFLDARIREGRGSRTAIHSDAGQITYLQTLELANRFGSLLRDAGVAPQQRVLIALPDSPDFVGALFGILKIGAVAVMLNPKLKRDEIEYFYGYTGATALIVHRDSRDAFEAAVRSAVETADKAASETAGEAASEATAQSAAGPQNIFVVGEPAFDARLAAASTELENFPTHRDAAAIWLFSGGTTGRPKAVVQPHSSFANTTECYAKGVIGYGEDDITLSVPKLYFGYATGSNLLFPFSVGAAAVLFPEPCSAELLFEKIERFRPTILINVPTMVNRMLNHPTAAERDLSCLRLSTSAGEALPREIHRRWLKTFGVELLDGLGTAEMWHIFLSNRPGEVCPGTLGRAVPGFDVRVRDDEGQDLPSGEVGWLWVRGDSLAHGYWQREEKTKEAFRGEWYVSGDMVCRDEEGFFTYCGRGDDMLKVSGKWLSPQEVEDCLLQHPAVLEVAVVGVTGESGLTKPHAFVVAEGRTADLEEELKAFVRERLEPYKYPREVVFVASLPRTHLGKVDRARIRRSEPA